MSAKTTMNHPGGSASLPRADNRRTADTETTATGPAIVRKSLVVLGTLLVCLAVLEVGLRLLGRYEMRGVDGFLEQGGLSYVHKKNATTRIFWPTLSFTVHTDEFGFRFKRPGPRPLSSRPYYAVLGSSEVFGNGLDYEQTFIGVLGQKMERQGIDVVNMAVAGHHFLEQDALFRQYTARAAQPPAVVLITLNPLSIGGYDDIHANVIEKRGELFPKDNWRLSLAKMVMANTSAAYCFFRDGIRNTQQRYFVRQDYALSFYVERYSRSHPIRSPEKTAAFLKHLGELEAYIRSLDATPVCVYIPAVGGFLLNKLKSTGDVDGQSFDTEFFRELVRTHCQTAGVQFVDVEPLLQKLYDRGEKLNFDADAHFNGPTSRTIGDYLYQSLQSAERHD